MKLLMVAILLCIAPSKLSAYRDGARENSCYDHAIDHGVGTEYVPCALAPDPCPYFLDIKEVIDEDTLEMGNEAVETYQCEKIYGIVLNNTLNDPEGFLIQARNGTETSSEILGTFLDPSDVRMKTSASQVNYKILSCNQSLTDMESESPLPNSATHPNTVNMAGVLQLYWQAPNCSTCRLGDLNMWFSVVQQTQVVFNISKTTILRLENYTEPDECPKPATTMEPTTSTVPIEKSSTQPAVLMTGEIVGLSVGVSVGGIVLIVLFIVFIGICCHYVRKSQSDNKNKPSRASQLWNAPPPIDNFYVTEEKNSLPTTDSEQNGKTVNDI